MQPPMTVRELSDYLRLDRMTIYKMLKEGGIPASRIGHQWRFFQEDIDKWIRSLRTGPKARVLLITGDATTAILFQDGLSDDSYIPTIASNTDEAISLVRSGEFDLVMLELSNSTVECFRQVRSINERVPVIIFLADGDGNLVQKAMDAGTFTLVKKPATADDLQSIFAALPSARPAVV
ncbi:MAG: helix-turn-helix domain-containing protein [Chloroflexi bacterium]|nr:helix-turn-helix domain-containing protein [Chloroflexota bacterium]